jgi:hypothetical protein
MNGQPDSQDTGFQRLCQVSSLVLFRFRLHTEWPCWAPRLRSLHLNSPTTRQRAAEIAPFDKGNPDPDDFPKDRQLTYSQAQRVVRDRLA